MFKWLKKELPKEGGRLETIEFGGLLFFIKRVPWRRKLSLRLKPDGSAYLSVPMGTKMPEMYELLHTHKPWIEKVKRKFEKIREEHPVKSFEGGETLLFLGLPHHIHVSFHNKAQLKVLIEGRQIKLTLPIKFQNERSDIAQSEIHRAIRRHYKSCAHQIFPKRIEIYSHKLDVDVRSLSLRSQKTRWGSCSSGGRISLNWRLMAAPLEVIDYVIVHELCHIENPNHSDLFWKSVEDIIPDYEAHEKWLRAHHYELDFLSKTSEIHSADASR